MEPFLGSFRSVVSCFAVAGVVVAAAAGCSSPDAGLLTCMPACGAGLHCDSSGTCVADEAPDLAAGGADLAMDCAPGCSPAAPHCSPDHRCVVCLVDNDCPTGSICTKNFCAPGCADDARCRGGGAPATMACCNGQCTDAAIDGSNCGTCGNSCLGGNAASSCMGGKCLIGACNFGFGDCNGNPADGCETNLHVDVNNCTGCGKGCNLKNAIAGCSDGCYLKACNFGFDDCDGDPMTGCELAVLSDVKNCGACGNACGAPAHATAACENGACQITSCVMGFTDCNHNPMDGCEVATATDVNNCGACGAVCQQGLVCTNGGCTCPQCKIPNSKSKCINNQCVWDSCLPGYADCNNNTNDGCEVNLTSDANNCNGCGIMCGGNTPYCVNSACSASTHAISQLTWDFQTQGGLSCGDGSVWFTQSFGQMTYDQCELLANKYGGQYMGQTGYFGMYAAPYAAFQRWVGQADAANGFVGNPSWNVVTKTDKATQQYCVLAYANDKQHGNATFNTTMQSANGKTYQVNDFGVISESTCYSNALAAGARPLNPWMFANATMTRAHMVEQHVNHGSVQYSGLDAYQTDGGCTHTYRCFVGYNP